MQIIANKSQEQFDYVSRFFVHAVFDTLGIFLIRNLRVIAYNRAWVLPSASLLQEMSSSSKESKTQNPSIWSNYQIKKDVGEKEKKMQHCHGCLLHKINFRNHHFNKDTV